MKIFVTISSDPFLIIYWHLSSSYIGKLGDNGSSEKKIQKNEKRYLQTVLSISRINDSFLLTLPDSLEISQNISILSFQKIPLTSGIFLSKLYSVISNRIAIEYIDTEVISNYWESIYLLPGQFVFSVTVIPVLFLYWIVLSALGSKAGTVYFCHHELTHPDREFCTSVFWGSPEGVTSGFGVTLFWQAQRESMAANANKRESIVFYYEYISTLCLNLSKQQDGALLINWQ